MDAEGCFSVLCTRSKKMKLGWRLLVSLQIHSHKRDLELLIKIREALGGVGHIYEHGSDSCMYRVDSLSDLAYSIIPHLDKYPLLTRKRADYELFKQVVLIMNNKEHLTEEGFKRVLSIKASMRNGLTDALAETFPNIIPVANPVVEIPNAQSINPNWLVGFTEGEGCFIIHVQKHSTLISEKAVRLNFQITRDERDKELLNSIILYLNCGTLKTSNNCKVVTVTRFEDVYNTIIPFFQKYPLQGNKKLNLIDFINAAELIREKAHLTSEGLGKILRIKSGMPVVDLKTPPVEAFFTTPLDSDMATTPDYSCTLGTECYGSLPFLPVVVYTNADSQKKQILSENLNKAGVYRWKNTGSGKTYIGSSQNLTKRFYLYFNARGLAVGSAKNMSISRALLKYGYSNFSLEILEYCEPNVTIEREQYYLDLCAGEYNILTTAGSLKGYKHSLESMLKMRGKNHTDESKALMSEAKIGINHPMFGKNTSEQTRVKISEAKGSAIKVTDLETNVEENVFSIRKAAELLRVDHSNLSKRFKGSNCFILNGRYKIEKL